MSDGFLKEERSKPSKLGRAKLFLSIFHRNRENGAFPTADNGKRGRKQVRTVISVVSCVFQRNGLQEEIWLLICDFLASRVRFSMFKKVSITPFVIPDFPDTPNGECCSQAETDDFFVELANEHTPQDLFCSYDDEFDNKENNRPPKGKEGTTLQVPKYSPSIELTNTMETLLDISDEMDVTLEVDETPLQNRGTADQTVTPTEHADLDLYTERINFTSDFHQPLSLDPFVQIIRDNDQAPTLFTGSPPREETNLCKSLQSDFHQVVKQEAENYSFDLSKRVLFKETSNEVRFFSRSDSELELFRKKHRVSVRQIEPKYTPSLIVVDMKPEKEPAVAVETSAEFYNFFSKNWKSLEASAVSMKGNLSSWTSTLNMPDLLCNSPSEQEPPSQMIPLRNSKNLHPDMTQNNAETFKGVERSLSEFDSSHHNQQIPKRMSSLITSHVDNLDRTSENRSLEASESTEIMIREVKGQNFVAFGENENAIPFKKESSFVPIDRKKKIVNGARRWSRSQLSPSPQHLNVELMNDKPPVSQCLDHPLLLVLTKVDVDDGVDDDDEEIMFDINPVLSSSPVQMLSSQPPALENAL